MSKFYVVMAVLVCALAFEMGWWTGSIDTQSKYYKTPVLVNGKYVFCDNDDAVKEYAKNNSKTIKEYENMVNSFHVYYVRGK